MSDKGLSASKSGSVWVWIGGAVAVAIAAGSYMMVSQNAQPTSEDLNALVPQAEPVEETVLDASGAETADAPDAVTDGDNTTAQGDAETAQEQPAADVAGVDQSLADDTAAVSEETADVETVEPAAPAIDEVRLAADGVAVVAGRAEPGARVDVIVDGDVVATAEADASGSFAAIGIVEADDSARVLSLRSEQGDTVVASDDEVILAPVAKPQPDPVPGAESAPKISDVADGQTANNVPAGSGALQTNTGATTAENTDEQGANESVEVAEVEPQSSESVLQEASPEVQNLAPQAPALTEPSGQEPEAPQIALLKSDEEGVTLLQTAPEPPARIQLDTIGYSDSGAVQLAGRAGASAVEIRIYLNNRVAATLPVEQGSNWRGEVPDVDAGVYTLRVDAVDEQGAVTSRLETPFKREEPSVLAAATEGADGPATAVTVQQGDTLWAIARDRYGEGLLYVQVFEANRTSIRDPDLIYPGQIFELPPDQ